MSDDDVGKLDYERPRKWVVVQSFETSSEAHLARMQLERAGIPSTVENENVANTLWHAQFAVGGVKVRVPPDLLEDARRALAGEAEPVDEDEDDDEDESWRGEPDEEDDEEDEEEAPESDADLWHEDDREDERPLRAGEVRYAGHEYEDEAEATCPKCHSTDTHELSWLMRFAQVLVILVIGAMHPIVLVLAIAFAAYFLISKPRYRCTRCGNRWTPEP